MATSAIWAEGGVFSRPRRRSGRDHGTAGSDLNSRHAGRHARRRRNGLATKCHVGHHLNAAAPQLGGARISTTHRDVVQQRATSGITRPALSAGLLAGLLSLFFGAALAAAAPASAVDDPARPGAQVTHGPSCRPGGLVVEVVAGTAPYSVRLATTRTPSGEDEAVLLPGQTVVLRSDDVDWGETIDGRLEYAARDGSGNTFVDELKEYSFTRPTKEDCDAVAAPTSPHPSPSPSAAPTSATASRSSDGAPSSSAPSTSAAPTPSVPAGSAGGGGSNGGEAPARQVVAGDSVTLQASGFLPGERVTIRFSGSDAVLGSAVAAADGTVTAEVRIPDGTAAGPATVAMVGDDSAVEAGVDLRIAASETAVEGGGGGDLVSLTAAAAALVLTVGALVSVAGQRRSGRSVRHA